MTTEEIWAIILASTGLILATAAVGIAAERRRNNREAKIGYYHREAAPLHFDRWPAPDQSVRGDE